MRPAPTLPTTQGATSFLLSPSPPLLSLRFQEPQEEQEFAKLWRKGNRSAIMAMANPSTMHSQALSSSSFFGGLSLSSPRASPNESGRLGVVGPVRMEIKRWERKEVKKNSLPVTIKLHVKVGDTVKVIAGHDKGKVSTVLRLYTHNSKIVLKDVNLKTKHVKGKAEGETGQIVQVEAPMHSSNVMLYSKTAKVASRVGHKTLEDGRKVRYLLKTGEVIDSAEDWNKVHKKKDEKST